MTVSGALYMSGDSTTAGLTASNSAGMFIDSAFMNLHFQTGASTSNAWIIFSPTGGQLFNISGGGAVRTEKNILDDGAGNATVLGHLAITGNILENSSLDQISLPSSGGTLALTSQIPTVPTIPPPMNYFVGQVITSGGSFVNAYMSSGFTTSGGSLVVGFDGLVLINMSVTGSLGEYAFGTIEIATTGSSSILGAQTLSTNGPSSQSGATETLSGQVYVNLTSNPETFTFTVTNFSSYSLVVSAMQLAT